MSITNPDLATCLNFFHKELLFLFANAENFILFPSKNYYFFRVAINEAIMLPALLPAIILGMQSASIKVCTTPM